MPRSDPDFPTKRKPPLFWWFLANILALAFAITAWVVCLNLFRDPTNPKSYDLMLKVGRIDPLKAFTRLELPTPRSVSDPLELEARYQSYTDKELETLNHELKRAYLTNFNRAQFLTYVTGNFKVLEIRELTSDDFISPGIAVRAQALVIRDQVTDPIPYPVFVECIFPTDQPAISAFEVGNVIMLKKQPNYAALIHVTTTDFDERNALLLTLVPLHATEFTSPLEKIFKIKPPERANVAATLPFFR
jgi:hypothetical protein